MYNVLRKVVLFEYVSLEFFNKDLKGSYMFFEIITQICFQLKLMVQIILRKILSTLKVTDI